MKGGKLVAAAAAAATKANNGANQNQNHNQNQTDFLVCFPSTARLALMPKAICSPSRPPELHKRHSHHHPRHTTKSSTCTTKPAPGSSHSRSSALFKTKTRNDRDAPEAEEPTSPKVTCAGQIKVRSAKPRSSNASSRPSTDSKNWISVMEEIERIRKDGKKKSGNSWWEALGFKKDVLQIFSSFHGLRFNMGCFAGPIDCTSDEEEEDEESVAREEEASSSKDVFSKWFMLIEQNHDNDTDLKEEIVLHDEEEEEEEESEEKDDMQNSVVPPPNALLLMRCRSAPAKGLLNRAELLETEEDRIANKAKEEEKEEQEKLLVMRCAPDFFKVSMDIAKETWVVGGELDLLARSRSCRR